MSEDCNQGCSSCAEECSDRQEEQTDFPKTT